MRFTILLFLLVSFSCQNNKINTPQVPTEIEKLVFDLVKAWSERDTDYIIDNTYGAPFVLFLENTTIFLNDFENIKTALGKRGYEINQKIFAKLDMERKTLQIEVENLQSERNKFSADFGELKSSGKDTSDLKKTIDKINAELDKKSIKLNTILENINNFLLDIPNIPDDSVPHGKDEKDNIVVEAFGLSLIHI